MPTSDDLMYMEIEFMSYDYVNRQMVLKTRSTDLPANLAPDFPVYINFVSSETLSAGNRGKAKQNKGAEELDGVVESFFSQFYYTLNQDSDGNYMLNAFFRNQ